MISSVTWTFFFLIKCIEKTKRIEGGELSHLTAIMISRFPFRYFTKKNQVKQYCIRLRRRQRRPDGGDPVKLFDVQGIDISEELDQRSKMSLSLMVSF